MFCVFSSQMDKKQALEKHLIGVYEIMYKNYCCKNFRRACTQNIVFSKYLPGILGLLPPIKELFCLLTFLIRKIC